MLFLPLLIARFRSTSSAAASQLDRDLAEKGGRIAHSQREQVQALRAARVGPWSVATPTFYAHRAGRLKTRVFISAAARNAIKPTKRDGGRRVAK